MSEFGAALFVKIVAAFKETKGRGNALSHYVTSEPLGQGPRCNGVPVDYAGGPHQFGICGRSSCDGGCRKPNDLRDLSKATKWLTKKGRVTIPMPPLLALQKPGYGVHLHFPGPAAVLFVTHRLNATFIAAPGETFTERNAAFSPALAQPVVFHKLDPDTIAPARSGCYIETASVDSPIIWRINFRGGFSMALTNERQDGSMGKVLDFIVLRQSLPTAIISKPNDECLAEACNAFKARESVDDAMDIDEGSGPKEASTPAPNANLDLGRRLGPNDMGIDLQGSLMASGRRQEGETPQSPPFDVSQLKAHYASYFRADEGDVDTYALHYQGEFTCFYINTKERTLVVSDRLNGWYSVQVNNYANRDDLGYLPSFQLVSEIPVVVPVDAELRDMTMEAAQLVIDDCNLRTALRKDELELCSALPDWDITRNQMEVEFPSL